MNYKSSKEEEEEEKEFGTFDLEIGEPRESDSSDEQAVKVFSKILRRGISGGEYKRNSYNYEDNKKGLQNSTMSFFNRKSKRYSPSCYSNEMKKKWLSNMHVVPITICERLYFYMNSLYNNRIYKFKFIQYMGELNMMYEQCNTLMYEILEKEKESQAKNKDLENKNPLYFLHETDDISNTFLRIDVFLRRHLQFMKLCSAPVEMFMDNYYTARSNCCGLIEIVNDVVLTCGQDNDGYNEKTFYLHYADCEDTLLKAEFLAEMEHSHPEDCDRLYSTTRRVAALHTILGELHAISEFIKTAVEMNDQLLFRLLMLFGSFLTLLGEYVWNTQMKQYHYYT